MADISIREYGLLTHDKPDLESLDVGHLANKNAWSFLEKIAHSNHKNNRFIKTASYQGTKALKILNFVGVITTPDGTQIEILPKTSEDQQNTESTRELLWKMLGLVENLKFIETTEAELKIKDQRLPEALISIFLMQLSGIVRRGIRKDYKCIEAEELFVKGRLQVSHQLRQPPFKQHRFKIEYHIFSDDRPENRLIHSALIKLAKCSKSEQNQRLIRELRFAFNEVSESDNHSVDFKRWRYSRDMIYYQMLLPCGVFQDSCRVNHSLSRHLNRSFGVQIDGTNRLPISRLSRPTLRVFSPGLLI